MSAQAHIVRADGRASASVRFTARPGEYHPKAPGHVISVTPAEWGKLALARVAAPEAVKR